MIDFIKNLLTGVSGVLLSVLILLVFIAIAVFVPATLLYWVSNALSINITFWTSSGIIVLIYMVSWVGKNL